jgi:hypothetical protein
MTADGFQAIRDGKTIARRPLALWADQKPFSAGGVPREQALCSALQKQQQWKNMRQRIVRQKGKPTLTTTEDPVFGQLWHFGETSYIIVAGEEVVREGKFASASEAEAALKPVPPEILYVKCGKQ